MNIKKKILEIFEDNKIELDYDVKTFLDQKDYYSMDNVWFNVCFILDVNPYYARGKDRNKYFVKARQYFCIILLNDKDKLHDYSLTMIGNYIDRHHATVLYSKKRIEDPNENNLFNEFYERYLKLTENEQTNEGTA